MAELKRAMKQLVRLNSLNLFLNFNQDLKVFTCVCIAAKRASLVVVDLLLQLVSVIWRLNMVISCCRTRSQWPIFSPYFYGGWKWV